MKYHNGKRKGLAIASEYTKSHNIDQIASLIKSLLTQRMMTMQLPLPTHPADKDPNMQFPSAMEATPSDLRPL